jgi:hypothetical protein
MTTMNVHITTKQQNYLTEKGIAALKSGKSVSQIVVSSDGSSRSVVTHHPVQSEYSTGQYSEQGAFYKKAECDAAVAAIKQQHPDRIWDEKIQLGRTNSMYTLRGNHRGW